VPDFVITEAAQADLEQIDEYIAADNSDAADRLLDDLYGAMQSAADDPERAGSIREDLTERDVRFVPVRKNYWVVYAKGGPATITIVRVLHSRRDVRNVL